MSNFLHSGWVAALLERSGLRSLVERYHNQLEQHEQAVHTLQSWKAVLLSSRMSSGFPVIVGLLAVISAGTGTYPFSPVLVAAVVFAPFRWRSIYAASALGAATGAALLALVLQLAGDQHAADFLSRFEDSAHWLRAKQWIDGYGSLALAAIAALPVPEMPALLTLTLAKTPPWQIWLAVLAGKMIKYGAYILGVRLVLKAIQAGRE